MTKEHVCAKKREREATTNGNFPIADATIVHLSYFGASHKFTNPVISFQSDSKEAFSNHDFMLCFKELINDFLKFFETKFDLFYGFALVRWIHGIADHKMNRENREKENLF